MIGKITGTISDRFHDSLILDTSSGVGYQVFVPRRTLLALTELSSASLYIHTHVRESEFSLYGFNTKDERVMFDILLDVPGIGPKSALTIIGHAALNELYEALRTQNVLFFSSIKGVGNKTAQKILLELSSKFGTRFSLQELSTPEDDELLEALAHLGFQKNEVMEAIREAKPQGTLEEKIAQCLQLLARS